MHDRVVSPDQKPVHRIPAFGDDVPANKDAEQRRGEGDGQQRAEEHRKGFGEGQRAEQPAALCFQHEDRQERNGDHQQGKEDRLAHGFRGADDDCLAFRQRRQSIELLGFAGGFELLPFCLLRFPVFEFLVDVLDNDDRAIDHCADGNGNATQ